MSLSAAVWLRSVILTELSLQHKHMIHLRWMNIEFSSSFPLKSFEGWKTSPTLSQVIMFYNWTPRVFVAAHKQSDDLWTHSTSVSGVEQGTKD